MKWLSTSAAIAGLLSQVAYGAPLCVKRQNSTAWTAQEWDAIVVGAGTAGIIVADRLSEAGKKTLLLELGGLSYGITGGTEKPAWLNGTSLSRVDVPGLYKSIFNGGTDLLCPSDVVNAFQACTIGGNSAINAGLYFQPPASDWDNYHPEGWKSADVKDATQRLLDTQPSVTTYSLDGKYYMQTGYEEAKKWLVDAAGFSDVSFNEEPDNKDKVFGRPVYNYINGQRGGPTRTYLQNALARSNFRLQTGARVRHINHVRGAASSITVEIEGSTVEIALSPNGRIVLSAGAIASPGLLMHSGIGPLETLTDLSKAGLIPNNSSSWVVNSLVGEGLFDNPNTFIELSAPTIESYVQDYNNPIPADRDLYLSTRSGPYAFASQTSAFWAYMPNPDGTKTGVQGTIDSSGHGEYGNNHSVTLNVYGTSGLGSAGRVVLSQDGSFIPGPSSDVYYTDPRDAENIAAFIYSIFQALPPSTPESLATDGLTPLNIPQNSTVEEIRTYITTPSEYAVGAVQHWSSSCRIGKCVDADTKVIGTENIHVVDASIVSPLTVNPQFGVMIAAEKGAERILETWKSGVEISL
ncbi:putative cellobiose dehydrogenase [Hypoxylon rubiginosum]|uniref:Cellobiose dehydrogenase n=1 Tax=Hypoxylon rubiginosum TaxID=110542 RepID=A0ACB9YPE0_9PEZI|nr:putative cellobiose dehydrogenase [Hypoxylon rubiginosum]